MAVATGGINALAKYGGTQQQKMVLPVIAHPKAKLNTKNLAVRGESRSGGVRASCPAGIGRDATFVGLRENGHVEMGLNKSNLPTLQEVKRPASVAALSEILENTGRREHSRGDGVGNKSSEEIEDLLRQKLQQSSNIHSLKHLFKINDPTGEGTVTREAFQRVLIGLLGYISTDQVARLLKRIGLDEEKHINYDHLKHRYVDKNSIGEWLNPAHQVTIQQTPDRTTESLLTGTQNDGIKREGLVSAPFCYALLRERARRKEFNIREYFPSNCFEDGGVILEPQLKEFVSELGYELKEEQAAKLWSRYDPRAVGAAKTSQFLSQLGLDESGEPKRTASLLHPSYKREATSISPPATGRHSARRHSAEPLTTPQLKPARRIKPSNTDVPRLAVISDCLNYKFEQNYHALLEGLRCFDFLNDGMITVMDMKRVFKEFGFVIGSIDFENFLTRSGVRPIQGQLQYEDFMLKFWNRSERSLVHRIVTNNFHCFAKMDSGTVDEGLAGMSAEQMESKMIDFIHGDFMKLLSNLQKCDKHSIGVVTQYEFKDIIEQALGYKMDSDQFKQLKEQVVLDPDGLVPYNKFMESFNIKPGWWNRRTESATGIVLTKVDRMPTPPEVERLRQKAKAVAWAADKQEHAEQSCTDAVTSQTSPLIASPAHTDSDMEGRSVHLIRQELHAFFQVCFHTFDKVFKNLDRRMTGRFHKHQFREMLKECDCHLTMAELNRIWDVMPTAEDNMMNIIGVVRFFSKPSDGPPPIKDKRQIEDSVELVEKVRRAHQQQNAEANMEDKMPESPKKQSALRRISNTQRNVILDKARKQVISHWDEIKSDIRHLDYSGFGSVNVADMQKLLVDRGVSLTDEEMSSLAHCYDFYHNGRFHYMDFLTYYTQTKSNDGKAGVAYNPGTHQVQQPNISKLEGPWIDQQITSKSASWHGTRPTINQVIHRMRVKLTVKYKSLRRAFKKIDSERKGLLNPADFRKALKSCEIDLTEDDLFHIMAEFDPNLKGKISYGDFLTQLTNI